MNDTQEAQNDGDLDFTQHFSPETPVPEPQHTPEQLRDIDDLGSIGAAALKDSGFYARIINASQGSSPASPQDTTILIVEDDPGTSTIIRRALEKYQYQTRQAHDRQSFATALHQTTLPDLIMLDVMLPGMNGFDVLNRIRQHKLLENVPVIMLTSLSERQDIARGLSLGADAYLTKPILPSTLIDAVQVVLGGG